MFDYWLARNGQRFGPYSVDDLQRMCAQGQASVGDTVWAAGMPSWTPLSTIIPMPSAAPVQYNYGYASPAVGVIPPHLPWGLVLFLSVITIGFFFWIWFFVQASYARKLNRDSGPTILLALSVIFEIGRRVSDAVFSSSADPDFRVVLGAVEFVFFMLLLVASYNALFRMRRALEEHYNQVEPIYLRLSAPMTFFFGIFYLQHHLTRIARWKQTGYLAPQSGRRAD
jgi:hypothetical protein